MPSIDCYVLINYIRFVPTFRDFEFSLRRLLNIFYVVHVDTDLWYFRLMIYRTFCAIVSERGERKGTRDK